MLRSALEQCMLAPETEKGANGFSRLVFTFELVPARASKGKALDDIIRFAKETADHGRICALSITENAGGHPALTPRSLGAEIKALGIAPIIHFSCKDKNRNLIESELFELDRAGLNTLLVLTGDFPRYGYKGRAKPVFDLDSVLVLSMIQEMRRGLVIHSKALGGGVRLAPMDFYAGCVVSPFKRTIAEQVQQYIKLKRKIQAGAKFVITQMGYDIRKYQEVRLLLDKIAPGVPLLGTVLIPNLRLAKIIHNNVIPGCTMPTRYLREIEASGGSLDVRLDKAAKLVALLYGLGYQGIHLSGPGLEYEHIAHVIAQAEDYSHNWPSLVEEFLFPEEWNSFIFHRDSKSGLNSPELVSIKPKSIKSFSLGFFVGRIIHELFFEPGKGFFEPAKKLARLCEEKGCGSWLARFEYFIKELLYDCQRCGDCYLGDLEFICPQSQCAKKLVNGPCGGSQDGWCEVLPKEKRCLFVRQFERAAWDLNVLFKEQNILPPRDWGLDRRSSWLNFFLGRDHNHKNGKTENED